MTEAQLTQMAANAMIMTAKLAMPLLLTSLVVGLVVSVFQSVTSIQETSLSFVPKLVAIALVLTVAGHWMLGEMVGYTQNLFDQTTSLLGG